MVNKFRGSNLNDIETAAESLVLSAEFSSNLINKASKKSSSKITAQHHSNENIDNIIEKK
jgi:hypothetical protein